MTGISSISVHSIRVFYRNPVHKCMRFNYPNYSLAVEVLGNITISHFKNWPSFFDFFVHLKSKYNPFKSLAADC